MKYLHYKIDSNEISENKGEVTSIPDDFIEYQITMGGKSVYYKIKDEKITDVIGEGMDKDTIEQRVEEFLSGFNVGLV